MDLNALKALAKQKKEVWHKAGDFELRIKRLSLMDLHRLEVAAQESAQVGDKIHTTVNVVKRTALAFDAVTGWRGVRVEHLVPGHEDAKEEVPFDRELLDVLNDNYPVIRAAVDTALYTGAVSYSTEIEGAEKN